MTTKSKAAYDKAINDLYDTRPGLARTIEAWVEESEKRGWNAARAPAAEDHGIGFREVPKYPTFADWKKATEGK